MAKLEQLTKLAKIDKIGKKMTKLVKIEKIGKKWKKWHTFYLIKFILYNESLKIQIIEKFQCRNLKSKKNLPKISLFNLVLPDFFYLKKKSKKEKSEFYQN